MREAGEMIFVDVCVTDTGETADLRIPRDIPVCALAKALSARFKLGIPDGLAGTIALRTLWPQGLMAGSRPVGAFGVRDGTRILVEVFSREAAARLEEDAGTEKAGEESSACPEAVFFSSLPDRLRVGTDREAGTIRLTPGTKGRRHVVLERDGAGYGVIAAAGYVFPVLNGKKAGAGDRMELFDCLRAENVTACLFPAGLLIARGTGWALPSPWTKACPESQSAWEYPVSQRTARIRICPSREPIEILPPGEQPPRAGAGMLIHMLPALVMFAVMAAAGRGSAGPGAMLIRSAGLLAGVLVSLISYIGSVRKWKKDSRESSLAYREYIDGKRRLIEDARAQEKRELEQIYPGPETLLSRIETFDAALFDRDPADEDFLDLRIGEGACRARRPVTFTRREKIGPAGEGSLIPENMAARYAMIEGAPVVLSLKETQVIGVAGPWEGLRRALGLMLLDLTCRQSFRDLQLYILLDPEEDRELLWCRWLPHAADKAAGRRRIICDEAGAVPVLDELYAALARRQQEQNEEGTARPHIVVLALRDHGLRTHPVSRFFGGPAKIGASFVFFSRYQELLPARCRKLVLVRDGGYADIYDTENGSAHTKACMPGLPPGRTEAAARKLAPVVLGGADERQSLPERVTLFEMLGIRQPDKTWPMRRWAAQDAGSSLAIPAGISGKGRILSIDLHEAHDGPHGLIAGTTGSGKSELLQTLLICGALHYPPSLLSFFIIDFKGGGMADQFMGLPHLAGKITNLDEGEARRSLRYIRAELLRRQKLLALSGVNTIHAYQELAKMDRAKEAMPHLLIVVDEFAELKTQHPAFMNELISAARIGRSLGVHLILATQKPAGQVNDQIWSNSNFRICLRVQSPTDSMEVIRSPLAAEIRRAGRAYLQTGNKEGMTLFQSAYSGAPWRPASGREKEYPVFRVLPSGIPEQPMPRPAGTAGKEEGTSQLTESIRMIREACTEAKEESARQICLPALSSCIPFPEEGMPEPPEKEKGLWLSAGIYEDPENQYAGPLFLDLSAENVFYSAAGQMGRTNFLSLIVRSLAETYPADEVMLYLLDFSSGFLQNFEELPHVGGVLLADEEDRLEGLLRMLKEEISYRRDAALRPQAGRATGEKEKKQARILVLADNFSLLRERCEERFGEEIIFLLREGPACGISFAAAGERISGAGFRYMSHFGMRLCGFHTDAAEYSAAFGRMGIPLPRLSGRFQFFRDGRLYEAQQYLAFAREDETPCEGAIREFIRRTEAREAGRRARLLPRLPRRITAEYVARRAAEESGGGKCPVGIGCISCGPAYLDLFRHGVLVIAGNDRRDRRRALRSVLAGIKLCCRQMDVRVWICGEDSSEEADLTGTYGFIPAAPVCSAEALGTLLSSCRDDLSGCGCPGAAETMRLVLIMDEEAPGYFGQRAAAGEQCRELIRQGKRLPFLMIFADIENEPPSWQGGGFIRYLREQRCMILTDDPAGGGLAELSPAAVRRAGRWEPGDACLLAGSSVTRIRLPEE